MQLQVNGGKITDALLFSDAMQQEVVARISEILLGVNYDEQTMTECNDDSWRKRDTKRDGRRHLPADPEQI